jgi:hypothetical protein
MDAYENYGKAGTIGDLRALVYPAASCHGSFSAWRRALGRVAAR